MGAFFLVVVGIMAFFCNMCLKKHPNLKTKLRNKTKILLYNSFHTAVCYASLPILYNTFLQLKASIDYEEPLYTYVAPIMIISVFVVYPWASYRFIKKNIRSLEDKVFFSSHYALMQGTSYRGLWFVLPMHLRRVVYTGVLVFARHY
jgi:uncharacterized membrane protein